MPISISIKPEDLEWLKDLPGNFRCDLYKGVSDAMLFAEGEAKMSFGKPGHLKVRSGTLRRSIRASSTKDEGSLSSSIIYARIHELGGKIRAKPGKFLRFKAGGKWRTVKEVVMPQRAYLLPAFEDNMPEITEIILDTVLKGIRDE